MFWGIQEQSCPHGSTGLLWRRKQGCAVMPDSITGMLVLGGQESHHLHFNREMEMSRQRWTHAGSPGSGLQHLAPHPPSKQQCCGRWAGSLPFSSLCSRAQRVPWDSPAAALALAGAGAAGRVAGGGAAGAEGGAGLGDASHPARSGHSCPHWAPAVGTAPANVMSLFFLHSMTEKEVPEPPASPASSGKPKSRVSGCSQGSLGGWGKPPF